MNKIYILSHRYQHECCHDEIKTIATVSSEEEAVPIIEKYKKLEGFCDYPDGFYLEEYIIDELDSSALVQVIKSCKSEG